MIFSTQFNIILWAPFVAAVVSPWAYKHLGKKAVAVPLLGAALPFLGLLHLLKTALQTNVPLLYYWSWIDAIHLNLVFTIDGFGGLFGVLVAGMGTLIVWYAHHYMEHQSGKGRFFGFLLFFLGSMIGVALSEHILTTFIFWELTSLSSFFLIGFWHKKEASRAGALKALVITGIGGLFMFAGFALLGGNTGLWTYSQIAAVSHSVIKEPWMSAALVLILIGAFTKSAQFPFHIWLPDAMQAPTPVSAFLHSATMVKAGIILIFKIFPIFSTHVLWFPLLSIIGMTTVVVGAVLALKHTDLKAILAYSTISQLGLFVALQGYASHEAILRAGLIFHIFIHAFYKGSLFMLAGIIDHANHTRDIRYLGNLKKTMPNTCLFVCLAAASLAGLPPFLGFISKEGALESSFHMAHLFHGWPNLLPLALTLSATLTVAVAAKISIGVFFKPPQIPRQGKESHPHESSWGFLFAPAILASAGLVFGLAPIFLEKILYPAAMLGLPDYPTPHFSLWHGFSLPLLCSVFAIVVGLVLFNYRIPVQKIHEKLKLGWNLNTVYDKKWEWVLGLAQKFTDRFQNGSLSQYTGITLGFFALLMTATFLIKLNGIPLNFSQNIFSSFETLVAIGLILSCLMVILLKDRIARILSLSVVGLLICIYFVLRGAPDLALTGFLVEIVMFIVILLVFRQLKDEIQPQLSQTNKIIQVTIASLGGLVIGLISFFAITAPVGESIADYFLENSQRMAGGLNVVNVIVVDFRGFDTLGEISVLCLAGLGIFALRQIWMAKEHHPETPKELTMRPLPNSPILQTVSAWAFPVIIVFSIYMVFRGHNHPGGGFIGGLITAGALVLELLAEGKNRFLKLFPFQGKTIYSVGLALAFLTGLGPLFFGYPFLTSYLIESLHFSTAGLFDLGVYLVVVGVTLEIVVLVGSTPEEKSA